MEPMHRVRRFLARSPLERRLLLCAVVSHVAAWGMVRIVRFGALRRWQARLARRVASPRGDAARERAVLWAAATAAALMPFGHHCLPAALNAQWLLLLTCGRRTAMRIGVASLPGRAFAAHAWLESDGCAVFGAPEPSPFLPLR
jgi:hypothetical protein